MNSMAKSIQIFLPDGNPRGIRIAEMATSTLKVIVIPRNMLKEGLKRSELKDVGIYFLFGVDKESGEDVAYIGETEDFSKRLKSYNTWEFWSVVVVVTTKSGEFTKLHGRYLEWRSYEESKDGGVYRIENSNPIYRPKNISDSIETDLHEFFNTANLLLSTLGFPIFEKYEKQELLYCMGKNADARGKYIDDGLLILKGSKWRKEVVKSVPGKVEELRGQFIRNGTLTVEGESLVLTRDVRFNSPWLAASMVLGSNVNGWAHWKNKQGLSMDKIYRQTA